MIAPYLISIIISQKSLGDFRGYVNCEDLDGDEWELRGTWGSTPEEAFSNAMKYFNDYDNWDIHGYIISDEVE